VLITAYAVKRPDGMLSLMLINKDELNPHEIRINFDHPTAKSFSESISMISFGSEQYIWKSDGPNGHPEPNDPPVTKTLSAGTRSIVLPKASVTILRASA